MAKLVAIATNYLTITDTVSSVLDFEGPLKNVRYIRLPDSKIRIYLDGDRTGHSTQLTSDDSVFEDAGGAIVIYDYLKANTAAGAAAGGGGGGGGEFQNYEFKGFIDSATANNWIMLYSDSGTSRYANEYTVSTTVATSSSAVTIPAANAWSARPFGIAKGTQTVDSLTLWIGDVTPSQITSIAIIKASYSSMLTPVYNYFTLLYENASLTLTDGSRFLQVPSGSFSETSISDNDIVYLFLGTNTSGDVKNVVVRLKCSID
jgi:hypothetical protein